MTDVTVPQVNVLVTYRATTEAFNLPQANVMAVYNLPAENINATYSGVKIPYQRKSRILATQANVMAVVRGSLSNPKLRSWTFDLDGHEFYVLNLGNGKSLILDLTTESWSWWASNGIPNWRVQVGTNWVQSGLVSQNYGSNVVVGDSSLGILWMLDPEQGYDDPLFEESREAGMTVPFERVATGQVLVRGRDTIGCYQVYLDADTGQPAYAGAKVTLSYSDDQGNTFVDAGDIISVEGNYYQEFAWRSLGLVRAPGRLFRITDDGAFAKINELDIADVGTAA